MDAMTTGILTSVIAGSLMVFINAIVRRYKVKSVSDERIDAISDSVATLKEHSIKMEEENRVIFKMLLPLLLSVKGHKPNGELDEALRLYNKHLQER